MIGRVFERRTRLDAPAEEVYGWHARPGALEGALRHLLGRTA